MTEDQPPLCQCGDPRRMHTSTVRTAPTGATVVLGECIQRDCACPAYGAWTGRPEPTTPPPGVERVTGL